MSLINSEIQIKNHNDNVISHPLGGLLSKNRHQALMKMWKKGNSFTQLMRMQNCAATMENSMKAPQKN